MSHARKKRKVGRNDSCPCGSGKKFKKCHGGISSQATSPAIDPEALRLALETIAAQQKQRKQQQGLGRPIISTVVQGQRVVAVGSKVLYSPRWKTFHDFLFDYIKTLLGSDWGTNELKKPREERHPILNWYYDATMYVNSHIKERGKVHNAPATGVVSAYLALAYNLYCLEHNAKVQAILLNRLRHPDQFHGACYEVSIAAALVRAGCTIEFEDESNSTISHCELTAMFPKTGKKFSVEAKARQPNKSSIDVGDQLYKALKKRADYTRLVFIEVNVPNGADGQRTVEVMGGVLASLRAKENTLTINGQPAPPAYVIVTNTPYYYSPDAPCVSYALIEGFKISDFKVGDQYSNIRDALKLREKHQELTHLMASMAKHSFPPETFDGEISEFAFENDKKQPRLIIGKKYKLPDGKGGELIGQLEHAAVLEKEKAAFGVFELDDGTQSVFSYPLTEKELAAYQKFPDTFFGTDKPHTLGINDSLELYDYFFEIYKNTSKEQLLAFLAKSPDFEHIKSMAQNELASIYCENLVNGTLRQTGIPKGKMSVLMAAVVAETKRKQLLDKKPKT